MTSRVVVVLCGPPGAGKTTAARASGLDVYDRDDARWSGEAEFLAALSGLRQSRHARAVVIRSGATSSARATAVQRVAATHMFMLIADKRVLKQRVLARRRADMVRSIAGIDKWFMSYDRRDGIREFTDWRDALDTPRNVVANGRVQPKQNVTSWSL